MASKSKKPAAKKKLPLSGLKVLELASVLAGPSVGTFLAELGATVLKIENPNTGGDITRKWLMPEEDPQHPSSYFRAVNQGKQHLFANIASKEGKKLLQEILPGTDILLVNFKPGDEKKFGLDQKKVRTRFRKLIYAQISGYGPKDPKPAFDLCLQAESGFMSVNGTKNSGPLKMPVAMIDILAAHHLKEGILAALLERTRTGKGKFVHVSLYDAALVSLNYIGANYLTTGKEPGLNGSLHPNIAPYGETFRLKDGRHLVLAVGNDAQFERLCIAIGRKDLAGKAGFTNNRSRVINRKKLFSALSVTISKMDSKTFRKKLKGRDVPFAFVRNLGEALSDDRSAHLLISEPGGKVLKSVIFNT